MFLNNLFEVPHDRFVFEFAATLEGGVIPSGLRIIWTAGRSSAGDADLSILTGAAIPSKRYKPLRREFSFEDRESSPESTRTMRCWPYKMLPCLEFLSR